MRGKAKSLLGTASVIAVLAGAAMLLPSTASAQINIPGIVFGGMAHGYYGGHYRGRRGRAHETRRKEEHPAKDEHPAKADHPVDTGDLGNNKPDHQQLSAHGTGEPQTAASTTPPPPKTGGDVPPPFTPSR